MNALCNTKLIKSLTVLIMLGFCLLSVPITAADQKYLKFVVPKDTNLIKILKSFPRSPYYKKKISKSAYIKIFRRNDWTSDFKKGDIVYLPTTKIVEVAKKKKTKKVPGQKVAANAKVPPAATPEDDAFAAMDDMIADEEEREIERQQSQEKKQPKPKAVVAKQEQKPKPKPKPKKVKKVARKKKPKPARVRNEVEEVVQEEKTERKESHFHVSLPLLYRSITQKFSGLELTSGVSSVIGVYAEWYSKFSDKWDTKLYFQYSQQSAAIEDQTGEVEATAYSRFGGVFQRSAWLPNLSVSFGLDREVLPLFDTTGLASSSTNKVVTADSITAMFFLIGVTYAPEWTRGGQISALYGRAMSVTTQSSIEDLTGNKFEFKADYLMGNSWYIGAEFTIHSFLQSSSTTTSTESYQVSSSLNIGYQLF